MGEAGFLEEAVMHMPERLGGVELKLIAASRKPHKLEAIAAGLGVEIEDVLGSRTGRRFQEWKINRSAIKNPLGGEVEITEVEGAREKEYVENGEGMVALGKALAARYEHLYGKKEWKRVVYEKFLDIIDDSHPFSLWFPKEASSSGDVYIGSDVTTGIVEDDGSETPLFQPYYEESISLEERKKDLKSRLFELIGHEKGEEKELQAFVRVGNAFVVDGSAVSGSEKMMFLFTSFSKEEINDYVESEYESAVKCNGGIQWDSDALFDHVTSIDGEERHDGSGGESYRFAEKRKDFKSSIFGAMPNISEVFKYAMGVWREKDFAMQFDSFDGDWKGFMEIMKQADYGGLIRCLNQYLVYKH